MPAPIDQAPRIEVRSRDELRAWLRANHRRPDTVWLVTYKKRHPDYLSVGDLTEELLCWGWIDSRVRGVDDDRVQRLISPRNPASFWSTANKARVARMRKAGKMTKAGERAIAVAVENGMWTFFDDVEALEVPPDLGAALDETEARAGWDAFAPGAQRDMLAWIKLAKTGRTRAARVAQVAGAAAAGEMPAFFRGGG